MSVAVIGMLSDPSATVRDWSTRTLRFQRSVSRVSPTKSSERPLKQVSAARVTTISSVREVFAPRASVTVSSTT